MASLPSVPAFAECFLSGARQRGYLPSAIEKALGKQNGTRQRGCLPSAEHSADNNTQQRPGLPSVEHSANRNTRQTAAAVNGRQPPLTLCRVSSADTWQSADLPSVIFYTRQTIFIFTFDLQTFSVVLIQYLILHVLMWQISRIFSTFL